MTKAKATHMKKEANVKKQSSEEKKAPISKGAASTL